MKRAIAILIAIILSMTSCADLSPPAPTPMVTPIPMESPTIAPTQAAIPKRQPTVNLDEPILLYVHAGIKSNIEIQPGWWEIVVDEQRTPLKQLLYPPGSQFQQNLCNQGGIQGKCIVKTNKPIKAIIMPQ